MFSNSITNYLPLPLYNPAGSRVGTLFAGSQNQPLLTLTGGVTAESVVLPDRLSYEYQTPLYHGTSRVGTVKFNQWNQLILFP